jgi:hypothetical protein
MSCLKGKPLYCSSPRNNNFCYLRVPHGSPPTGALQPGFIFIPLPPGDNVVGCGELLLPPLPPDVPSLPLAPVVPDPDVAPLLVAARV